MKIEAFFIGLTALAWASNAVAEDLVTPAVRIGTQHGVSCQLYNISRSPITTEIEMIEVPTGKVIDSSGLVTILPGQIAGAGDFGGQVSCHTGAVCRFP